MDELPANEGVNKSPLNASGVNCITFLHKKMPPRLFLGRCGSASLYSQHDRQV